MPEQSSGQLGEDELAPLKQGEALSAAEKQRRFDRYRAGVVTSADDDSHLSDYNALQQGQTTVVGLQLKS